MKMTDHSKNSCSIEYFCIDYDIKRSRLFSAPQQGGYVVEIFNPMRDGHQVCEKLSSSGITLLWRPSMGHLSALIRKEYRKAQADAKRRNA
jgi:hypothetical protein